MSQRIFVTCRSNHDPIIVGNLACEALLGRKFIYDKDYIRSAGNFENTHNPTKCQVLIDCAVADADPKTKIPLTCYKADSNGDQIILSCVGSSPMLYTYLQKNYAWGRRGAA
ncbi:hypothetical protein P154DRAFT_517271 [Amniculicola lignicola CBS 123094]|uniref:Uncharacterized protein n=1 Tax=Amniculicola lignicola CBS 123094 TaxID=1392246 RepID=A0A6A5X3W0_9PLEO|nr:hypothetical protein P154DRAFT_517271 [Amniculicola lignicola CBS 123094]